MRFSPLTALLVFLSILLPAMSSAQDVRVRTATIGATVTGPQTVVNSSALYVDEIFSQTQASLELIAATPEARIGDWEGVRSYLDLIAPRLAALYFFVLPDGSFHTLDGGLSSQNLSARAYFGSLFAGNPVRGFPLQSLTTGRKIAMLASPVVVDGKVVAAVGASVFLDELHKRLNREFSLPMNYTWFVLDRKGNTLLDRDGDFILLNVFEQGSPSMQQAVRQAMQYDRGAVEYTLGGNRQAYYRKLPNMDWWMFLAQTDDRPNEIPLHLSASLDAFATRLQGELNAIDASLADLIARRQASNDETSLRALLDAVAGANPLIVNAAYIDTRGVLRHIAPEAYRSVEGTDISAQPHVLAMLAKPAPTLGEAIKAVDGELGVSMARPLQDAGGHFNGSISALLRPPLLVESVLGDMQLGDDQEVWIMQTDGLILYDDVEEEIGLNLFTDPAYAEYASLLRLGRRIAELPDGEGSYVFTVARSNTETVKNAAWTTVSLHGREWRVVLTYRPFGGR